MQKTLGKFKLLPMLTTLVKRWHHYSRNALRKLQVSGAISRLHVIISMHLQLFS